MADPIHLEVRMPGGPAGVYSALLDARQFRTFTGSPARIDAHPGGAFRCFDDAITGRHIELVPDRRIVQAWRVRTWEDGVYSIVRFEFTARDGETQVVCDQVGFPADQREHLAAGWCERYWDPLAAFLRKAN